MIPGRDDFRPAELLAPLSLAQCVEQLRPLVGSRLNPLETKEVVGAVGDSALSLRLNLGIMRGMRGNSFQTILRARLTEETGGTRISCRFRLPIFFMIFMPLWFAGVLFAWVSLGFSAIANILRSGHWLSSQDWAAFAAPTFMLLIAILIVFGAWDPSLKERENLLDFLRHTLNARDAASGPLG